MRTRHHPQRDGAVVQTLHTNADKHSGTVESWHALQHGNWLNHKPAGLHSPSVTRFRGTAQATT